MKPILERRLTPDGEDNPNHGAFPTFSERDQRKFLAGGPSFRVLCGRMGDDKAGSETESSRVHGMNLPVGSDVAHTPALCKKRKGRGTPRLLSDRFVKGGPPTATPKSLSTSHRFEVDNLCRVGVKTQTYGLVQVAISEIEGEIFAVHACRNGKEQIVPGNHSDNLVPPSGIGLSREGVARCP